MESCDPGMFHPTLPLDEKHYQQCYQTFSRFMEFDMPYAYAEWYHRVLGRALLERLHGRGPEHKKTMGQANEKSLEDDPLWHMGVGSGSGEILFHFEV